MAEFSLNIDEIENEVNDTLKKEQVKLENSNLKSQAENNAVAIFDADLNNPAERENIMKPLEDFGLNDMARSSQRNKLLSTRFIDLEKGGTESENIGDKLSELNIQMKDLDPSKVDFTKKGVFGDLFNPVRKYFSRYQKAETAISQIIASLDNSSKVLQNDNTTLVAEENYLREVTKKLMADIELGKQMDESIEMQIQKAEIDGVDPEKISFVKEEVLFPLRQRIMDMQQMIVINQQGIVSLNVIRRNNKELIRGVHRAKNVTVTALRTRVMVASALYDQKIVMDKINITLRFGIKFSINNGIENAVAEVKDYIKSYVESDEVSLISAPSLFISNLIRSMENSFQSIAFIVFKGLNDYDENIQRFESEVNDINVLEGSFATRDVIPEYLTIDQIITKGIKTPQIIIDVI